MTTMKLYEAAADRARLLYRIPTVPNGKRTLELYHSEAPLLSERDGPVNATTLCRIGLGHRPETEQSPSNSATTALLDVGKPMPFADQAFDLVILHRTLDELASLPKSTWRKFDASLLFKSLHPVVAAGGVVSGCVSNRWSLKSMGTRLRPFANPAQGDQPPGHFTLRSLRKALLTAGFSDIQLFTLLPQCAAPSKLIDADPDISRTAFRHEFNIARHRPFTLGYFARIAMVELGLNRHLERAYFFWAIKSC